MGNVGLTILLAVVSSQGVWLLIKAIYDRCCNKKDKNDIEHREITGKLDNIEKNIIKINDRVDFIAHGCTRTQLMLLMRLFPQRQDEIAKVAHSYFVELDGNFYMGSLFKNWLKENNIEKPDWFNDNV